MSDERYVVHLVDGRVEEFETVTDLESDWLRCRRPGPSPREELPETTKYYHWENVARIERRDGDERSRVTDRDYFGLEGGFTGTIGD